MHEIRYLPLAREDIAEAIDYIAETLDSPQTAAELMEELLKTVERIAEFPFAFENCWTIKPLPVPIRKVPVKGYVLYYAVFDGVVEIRRFLHGKKKRTNL